MSIQAVSWVLENSTAELGARLVLIAIANHAHSDGTGAYPSYETIGSEARMDRRNAIAAVKRLEDEGHIFVSRGGGRNRSNEYVILGLFSGDVSSLFRSKKGDANSDVRDIKTVMLASPEPSLNHKPRKAAPKRTQAQVESDRRYGGEGARIPETTPEYIRAVEAIAEPPNVSVLPQKVSPEKAAEARKLIQQQLARRAAKV